MKLRGLILVTLLTLVVTGLTLSQARWFAAPTGRALFRRPVSHRHAEARDPFDTAAAWRWRQCQPTHWRACLLQP
jgi:hypothetical protein